LAVLGWRAYRAMLLPLLYLFFLVPTGYFLVPWLQGVTVWFAVAGLKLVGIPVFSDGILIDVPAGSFVVAEACAGLRFLIASVAFGVFFAALMYRSRVRWLTFVALSVIVPIIANGIRAWGIIALAEWTNSAEAIEADHIIYGWGFFTAVTLLLIVIGMRFADDRRPATMEPFLGSGGPAARPWNVAVAALIGLALAASGPAYAHLRDWRGATISLADVPPPPVAAPWTPVNGSIVDWKPPIGLPDREFLGAYADRGRVVTQYVALYRVAGFHNNLVRGTNELADGKHWQAASSGLVQARIDGKATTLATTEVGGEGRRLVVWDFYIVNGVVVASPMQAKLAQLKGIFGGDDFAAFVALAVEHTPDGEPPEKVLQDFLTAMGPPGSYLRNLEAR
ncbi:MAG TPA: EpsI family protein, partial [Stellaceae bacterium]|nr:EpsI family protein [Stellaceae bacterium]